MPRTDFDSDEIFKKNRFFFTFWTLKCELDETARKLRSGLEETNTMTLKLINNDKNPLQRRQFDPRSLADQTRVVFVNM